MDFDFKVLMGTYVITGALELAMVLTLYREGGGSTLMLYGLLLMMTLISIPMENSASAAKLRAQMGKLGAISIQYDIQCNCVRSAGYMFVFAGLFSATAAAFLAYGEIAFYSVLLFWRMHQMNKNNGE